MANAPDTHAAVRSVTDAGFPTDGIPDDGGDGSDYMEAVQATLDEWNSKEDEAAWQDL